MTRRTSRRRTSLRRNSYTSTPAGKKVVMAFLDKRAADSQKLRTDGKRLDGNWMGGRGIAEWIGDKIVLHDLGSKSAQTIQNIIRREAPANWLKPNSRRRTSLRRNTSLVKQGADASALALMKRIEAAVGSGAYDVAAITFERLDEWKRRFGAWPFDSKRYWRAVDEMQRGSQASMQRNSSKSAQLTALHNLYTWATGSDRTGNPYTKPAVREAIITLGDSRGYDLPTKRPSTKIAAALYDLAKWATGSDRTGNPHMRPAVRAAERVLEGRGGLGGPLRRNSRRTSRR